MSRNKIIALTVFALFLAVSIGVAFPLYNAYKTYITMTNQFIDEKPEAPPKEQPKLLQERYYTILIYGVDAGEWVNETYRPGPARADTIMLMQADLVEKKASMLSIPRDTLVTIPGRSGDDKINHAHAYGGADLLVSTVEEFSGIPIDFYLQVNYNLFKDVVDTMGGIEFELDRRIKARGTTLEPGLYNLDGDQAFAVVSFRNERMGDIARVERQQRFLAAVGRAIRQRPAKQLLPVLYAGWKHTKTNLSLPEGVELLTELRGIKETDIQREIVPGWFYNRNGVSYWRPDSEKNKEVLTDLFTRELIDEP